MSIPGLGIRPSDSPSLALSGIMGALLFRFGVILMGYIDFSQPLNLSNLRGHLSRAHHTTARTNKLEKTLEKLIGAIVVYWLLSRFYLVAIPGR